MSKRSNYKSTRRRTNFRDKDTDKRESVKEKANDPAWYTVSGQMTKDVASLSFNNPAGIQYKFDDSATGSFVSPGVLSICMAPTAGYSEGLSSPINIAAKNIYSYVRHANSGHSNYDSPDLILYLVAMANAYAFYGWMTRLYGMLRVYSQTNRYFGVNLVEAAGVDGDNLLTNIANFRAYINQYAIKLSALSVPATMSLYKRYMWMFSNLFLDENNGKGQIYMYNPAYIYKYEEYQGAGQLTPKPLCLDANQLPTTGMTFGTIVAFGNDLISAMIGSEDINIMSGDILKAYGKENIWALNLIPEEYAIAPLFSEEVLMQIHNTIFVGNDALKDSGGTRGWDSFALTQDPNIGDGCIICKPLVAKGGNVQGNQILDTWKTEVTPEDVIVATRNMVTGRRWSQGFTAITGFGSEIPIMAVLCNLKADGTIDRTYFYNNDDITAFDAAYSTGSWGLRYVSKLTYFNEFPPIQLVEYIQASPYVNRVAAASIGEVSNFTMVNEDDLEKMHLSAILSELAVPLLGNILK